MSSCCAGHRYFDTFCCTKPQGHDGDHGYAGSFWNDAEAADPPSLTSPVGDQP